MVATWLVAEARSRLAHKLGESAGGCIHERNVGLVMLFGSMEYTAVVASLPYGSENMKKSGPMAV